MTDAQAALAQVREALAARPTPGQWFAVNDGNRTEPFMNVKAERISGRGPTHEVAICATGDSPQSMETANARYIAACSPVNIAAILAHVEAQAAEIERLRSERDELRDLLLRAGFVPCDIPACNCGSWHHRYGLPERMQEIKDALAEAGHELSNANGNLTLNALNALVSERDELRRQLDPMGEEFASADELIAALRAEKAEDEATKRDARRYRWLRTQPNDTSAPRIDVVYWTPADESANNGEGLRLTELDVAIDAAMGGGDAG